MGLALSFQRPTSAAGFSNLPRRIPCPRPQAHQMCTYVNEERGSCPFQLVSISGRPAARVIACSVMGLFENFSTICATHCFIQRSVSTCSKVPPSPSKRPSMFLQLPLEIRFLIFIHSASEDKPAWHLDSPRHWQSYPFQLYVYSIVPISLLE